MQDCIFLVYQRLAYRSALSSTRLLWELCSAHAFPWIVTHYPWPKVWRLGRGSEATAIWLERSLLVSGSRDRRRDAGQFWLVLSLPHLMPGYPSQLLILPANRIPRLVTRYFSVHSWTQSSIDLPYQPLHSPVLTAGHAQLPCFLHTPTPSPMPQLHPFSNSCVSSGSYNIFPVPQHSRRFCFSK